MHATKIADMESFIEYKINNKEKSSSEGRALQLKTKYQRDLDHTYKKVDSKDKQLKLIQYESKKIKKQVWDQLLFISLTVQKLEKERHHYGDQMKFMREQKEKVRTEIETANKLLLDQQTTLATKLQQFTEDSLLLINQKQAEILELSQQAKDCMEKINEKEPIVQQYYNKKFSEQLLLGEISKTKALTDQIKQELAVLKQKQQKANKRAMEILKARQEEEKRETDKKKQNIMNFIADLNEILASKATNDQDVVQNWEIIRLKQNKLHSQGASQNYEASMVNSQKYRDIKDRIMLNGTHGMQIDEKLTTQYEQDIKDLIRKIEIAQQEEAVVGKLCQSLVEEQQSRDKEIKNLKETIVKISQNLGKA